MKKDLEVKGMSCAICKMTIEKNLNKLEGVNKCEVNLLENDMIIDYDENKIKLEDIADTVDKLGYELVIDDHNKKIDYSKLKLIISVLLIIFLMYVAMGHMLNLPLLTHDLFVTGIIELVIATIIYILEGKYFTSGLRSILHLNPNMDSLVAMSTLVSYLYSVYAIYKVMMGDTSFHYYFETGAMILVIVSIGKYIEGLNKEKTTKAIRMLANLRPMSATKLIDGKEVVVAIDDLKVGDIIIAKAGEAIAQDGVIIEGLTSIDESMLTGESMPVNKGVDQNVIGGTINLSGAIKIRVTRSKDDSVLNKIIALTKEATMKKIPIQRFADKVSSFFVPGVILIALITFIIWFIFSNNFELSMNFALSVLVISCPCALGLATPSAIMVANGVSAKNGILIRHSEVLEIAHDIRTVIMDKTGTITANKPKIIKEIKLDKDFAKVIYNLEKNSKHPIAKAILEKYQDIDMSFDSFKEISGRGIKAIKAQDTYLAGNEKLMEENGIIVTPDLLKEAKEKAYSYVLVAKNRELLGLVYIADVIKDESIEAVKELKELGVKSVMCTGDNKIIAQNIADRVKIDEYYSEVKPEDKYKIIKDHQKTGLVAMVGDGINDAIALSGADVSFAIAEGSDIAYESSDLILMKNDLRDIPFMMRLSSFTMRVIKENLFWALFYNVIFIPLAAGVFYPAFGIMLNPMIGAFSMSISSIIVLSNALRIRKMHKKEEIKAMPRTVKIEGMMCQHCVKHVSDALVKLGLKAEVSLENKCAIVYGDASDEAIKEAVTEAGYEVKEIVNEG